MFIILIPLNVGQYFWAILMFTIALSRHHPGRSHGVHQGAHLQGSTVFARCRDRGKASPWNGLRTVKGHKTAEEWVKI